MNKYEYNFGQIADMWRWLNTEMHIHTNTLIQPHVHIIYIYIIRLFSVILYLTVKFKQICNISVMLCIDVLQTFYDLLMSANMATIIVVNNVVV